MEEFFELVAARRSIGKVTQEPVPREHIEKMIAAGNWAPSHHNTQPWKFFVLAGEGRNRLGKAYGEIAVIEKGEGISEQERKELYEKAYKKAFRAPLIIAMACLPTQEERIIESEEFSAAAACIQNMLLAAHSLGYGSIWRTGKPSYHPVMKKLFGLGEKDRLMGLVYIGKPDMVKEPKRTPAEEKTEWWLS
ncbi:nitroreductase family protein [Aneurinibacillus tyrosinisolvens]|uniref:nitroreductase family protein n=1 Tax=Aneurinibacillus tyrosinisolvens TaxID=1443435 RepID=UPI00063F2CC2|nr:nitroreductase [Aneurinibacillus tyrosinisolvens]